MPDFMPTDRSRPTPRVPRRLRCGEEPDPVGEAGQVALLMTALVLLSLVVAMGLSRLGSKVVRAAQSQAAADATALAALQGGEPAARSIAADNDAVLLALSLETGWAQVTVRRDGATATATAALVDDDGVAPGDR